MFNVGHFRESFYAYLLFKNGTILTTITSTTSIHKERQQQPPSTPKENLHNFCLLRPKGKVSLVLEGLETSFWGQIGVELNFQSTGSDYMCGVRINSAHYQLKYHL